MVKANNFAYRLDRMGMIKIQKRSNRTWAAERPPLLITPASAKLRAEIDRIWIKPVSKQVRPDQAARATVENKKPGASSNHSPSNQAKPAATSYGSRWINSQTNRVSTPPPVSQRNTSFTNNPLVPKAPPQNGTNSKEPLQKSPLREASTQTNRPTADGSSASRNGDPRKETSFPVGPRAGSSGPDKRVVNRSFPNQPTVNKPTTGIPAKAPEEKNPPINRPVPNPIEEKSSQVEIPTPKPPEDITPAVQQTAPAAAPEESKSTPVVSSPSLSGPPKEQPEAGERTHQNGFSVKQPEGNGNGSGAKMVDGSPIFRAEPFSSLPMIRVLPNNGRPAQHPVESSRPVENGRKDYAPEPSNGKPALPNLPVRQSTRNERPAGLSGLERLLSSQPDLPAQTAVLGVSEDGLPVLLDLNDPASGAILVVGDEREAQLEMLRTAIASIGRRNSPRSVQFLVLTCDPLAWKEWISAQGFERHCLSVENADKGAVRDWILQLADWTEQRRLGQRSGPAVVLVMDTLSFLPRLEYDVRLNFDWMVREGPQAAIWPVAAVSTELVRVLSGRRMLRAFQTRILGYTADPISYVQLFGLDEQAAGQFNRPGEFAVQAGDQWLRFCLPGE